MPFDADGVWHIKGNATRQEFEAGPDAQGKSVMAASYKYRGLWLWRLCSWAHARQNRTTRHSEGPFGSREQAEEAARAFVAAGKHLEKVTRGVYPNVPGGKQYVRDKPSNQRRSDKNQKGK